jgi:uncharacterized SAM-binding protein YcdF (DUF218 family)
LQPSGECCAVRIAQLGWQQQRLADWLLRRSTFEDALYAAALLKPKPGERWLLVTSAMHMPRAVGCFRAAGFRVEPIGGIELSSFASFVPGISASGDLDAAAKESIGLIAYRLMGKTDALFPGP